MLGHKIQRVSMKDKQGSVIKEDQVTLCYNKPTLSEQATLKLKFSNEKVVVVKWKFFSSFSKRWKILLCPLYLGLLLFYIFIPFPAKNLYNQQTVNER